MPDYDETELDTDPAAYLNGPTGNVANRGNGGTTREGKVAVIQVNETTRVEQSGTTTEGGQGSGESTDTTGQQGAATGPSAGNTAP
jgi:hypothetical protein